MNKKKFIELLADPGQIKKKDREELLQIVADYPYAQVAHALLAKSSKNLDLDSLSDEVSAAAVKSSYRPVLKALIEGTRFKEEIKPPAPVEESKVEEAPIPEAPPVAEQEEEPAPPTPKEELPTGNIITFELSRDKEKPESYEIDDLLKTLKKNKEAYTEDRVEPSSPVADQTAQEEYPKPTADQRAHHFVDQDDSDEERARDLIEELKQKEKPSAVEERVREQQEIIDRFIESESDIAPRREADAPEDQYEPVDLAAISENTTDNFISENLANILLKQGKVDKAIDIYKKLIWKFPQKKTYFADRIRDLKQE